MTRVAISKSVLQWAIERSGKATSVSRKFPKLSEWINGEVQPTLKQLEQFAKETATPFGYLFLPNPPEEQLPIPHFRTDNHEASKRPSPNLLEIVRVLEQRQVWMREYLLEHGKGPLPFVRSAKLSDDPVDVATEIRRALGLNDTWASAHGTWTDALADLRRRVDGIGIIVTVSGIVGNNTRRKLNPEEFRGFVLMDDLAPFVFVNGADWKAAQMFTLAHELAHVWLGSSAAFDLRELQPATDKTEQVCNQIAAEFLVPGAALRELWKQVRRDTNPFESIARHFKVSILVAARRAQDLGLINKSQFLDFYEKYLQAERRKKKAEGGGDFYLSQNLRIGRPFAEAVVSAAREGSLLYRDAYQLTGLSGNTFEQYAKALARGGKP